MIYFLKVGVKLNSGSLLTRSWWLNWWKGYKKPRWYILTRSPLSNLAGKQFAGARFASNETLLFWSREIKLLWIPILYVPLPSAILFKTAERELIRRQFPVVSLPTFLWTWTSLTDRQSCGNFPASKDTLLSSAGWEDSHWCSGDRRWSSFEPAFLVMLRPTSVKTVLDIDGYIMHLGYLCEKGVNTT